MPLLALVAFAAIAGFVAVNWGVAPWVGIVYLAASALAFFTYGLDKAAAIAGRRRVPETLLLQLGLVGGWPGAVLAQWLFRHKISKREFLTPFWWTVLINVTVFVAVAVLRAMHTG